MAFVGDSSNFDLDDDGILRDSMSGTDLLIDDDGILRDDDPDLDPYKHVTRGHWTDSGIGGDKQSSTSTLQHMQNSFEEDLPPIGDESINISEFEASKDDLSFDRVGDEEGRERKGRPSGGQSLDLMDTLGSTLDKPDTQHGQGVENGQTEGEPDQQLFTDDYYKQLRDLGVLVDGVDLSRDSLNEFEELESRVTSRMEGAEDAEGEEGTRDLIGEYLASEYQKEKEEQEEDERERDEAEDELMRQEEEKRNNARHAERDPFAANLHGRGAGFQEEDFDKDPSGVYSRASSARTISSRSFPGEDDDDYAEDEEGAPRRRRRRRDRDYHDDDYDVSEYDEDKENANLSQNLGSQGGSQSQRTPGEDDDEIYHITSRMLPASPGSSKAATGKTARRRGGSGASTPSTPQRRHGGGARGQHGHQEHDEMFRDFDDARSVHSETGPYQRPISAASHASTASELVSRRQKKAEEAALNRIASARSQESFFQQGNSQDAVKRTGTPTHKRLLPQPSGGASGGQDLNNSFKVKSKSSGSISSSGPVRPTHSSVAEVSKSPPGATSRALPNTGSGSRRGSTSADRSRTDIELEEDRESGALSDRLTQEAQKRKQATELVQQLQKDYDNLLTKYALAELTIDQMRLDGRVTIHTDSPTPGQATSGVMSPSVMGGGATVPQVMSLRQSPAQQGVLLRSSPASVGHTSPFVGDGATADTVDGRPPVIPGDQRSRSRGVAIGTGTADSNFLGSSTSSLRMSGSSVTPGEIEDGLREFPEAAATMKVELMTQARGLDDRLETFWNSLSQGQLTLEEQEQKLDQIKGDHDKLRRTYLQAKDDYNVLRRSGVVDKDTINFDENKELEGQLFRLGMRFDEVHETVESNLKERPAQRQPFQTSNRAEAERRDGATPVNTTTDSAIKGRPFSRTSSMDPAEEAVFERRVDSLRLEYNDSMDAYRKLKYSADSSPEGEKEIESVVKRLNEICTEMPDMFRLSPEIQARCDKMKTDGKLNFLERKNSVWEKLNRREQEAKTQRQSPVPPSPRTRGPRQSPVDGRPPSILRQTSDASDVDSIRARLDGSRSSLGSILPDRMDRPPSRGHAPSSHQDRPSSRASNRSSRGGTARFDPDRQPSDTSRDRNSPTPSLPRPRKHAHELKDPKLSQMPDMRLSRNPGASDGESRRRSAPSPSGGAVGGARAGLDAEGALAALPGPGKLKQMTKQRGADDADSGFLGSMVGSGVGVPPLLPATSQQSLDQQAEDDRERERTLRLRQRVDDSSTITDNSIDTSSQAMRPPSGRRRDNIQGTTRQEAGSGRGGRQRRGEESYDGEEDTMDAVDSEAGGRRQQGGGAKRRSHRDSSREISLEVTLEEDDSLDSEVSTPRAPRQGPTPPPLAKKRNSGQQASANQEAPSPVKPRRPSSRTQTASETEEELRAINNSKIRRRLQEESENKKGGPRAEKETVHRTRLKSPPPPRPSSRGSPTTDLYHTRGRHSSGDSRRSGTGSRRGGHRETTREERQEDGHMREEIRQTQQGPHVDRPSSRQGRQQQQAQTQQQQQQRDQQQQPQSSSSLPPGLAPASDLARRVKDYEERSLGSSDVEIGSSVTRASSVNSSNRLKALQEEIEKLKEGVARANEKASRPPPQYPQVPPTYVHSQSQQTMASAAPPPAAAPANQSPDQHQDFYDPFDDPYGFMRMPRRRANSFSGGRERDWGEWYWNLPQNRQYDGGDIPLGYAAADAYAENAPQRRDGRERNTRENVKERMRQKRQERKQKEEGQAEAQATPPISGQAAHDPQTQALYDYYVPPSRYSARGMRSQLASRGYFTTPTGAKIYSSTGEEGDVEGEGQDEENPQERDWTHHWFGFQQGTEAQQRPWYQIRRASRPLTSPYGGFGNQLYPGSRLTQSQEDVRLRPPPQYGGFATQTASATCPMCGSSSSHTHANYTHIGHPQAASHPQPRMSMTTPSFARTASPVRGRSRSVGRSHSHSRYRVREYTSLSDSDEENNRHRSRSMSRGRSRPKSRSKHRNSRRYSSDSTSDYSGDDRETTGLDRSLSLSQDIRGLTKKMLGTLRGELRKSKGKQREFGSSYW